LAQTAAQFRVSNDRQRFEFNTRSNYADDIVAPLIGQHIAGTRGADMVEVQVWQVDPVTERDDLAVSLNDSGTGVGQVIAILYVAVNSNAPRTIVIDEPNSFLHPGAARKLIEILKSDPLNQHQYIIATHSS